MKQIIVDLCDNGGGYLQIATELANEFLENGQTIVYTEGRNSPRYDAIAHGGGKLRDMKAVFMVNQYSASASEILSGAIQDWDRGVIVGRRTFGKGLVQRPIRFEDGSMVRLTIALLYTFGPLHTEALRGRRQEELQRGHLQPLPRRRAGTCRQHTLCRFAPRHHAQQEACDLRRRWNYAR